LTNISGLTDLETYFAMCGDSGGASQSQVRVNFGQKPFKFPPPAGFLPLCTANLPRPTTDAVVRPDKYVGIVTYTGNGSTQSINVGFKPDLVWIKNRNGGANNVLQDSVRGFGSSKNLSSNQTQEEGADTDGVITGVTNNGFNVAINAGDGNGTNRTNYTYVGWAWKAGGNSNTYNINDIGYSTAAAAGLTAGTITPTGASVNTKSGFSIIKFNSNSTGGTISHGLGSAPKFIICKNLGYTSNWPIYHIGLAQGPSGNNTLILDDTLAAYNANYLTDAVPTTTVFSHKGFGATSTASYIAYCWAEIPGFSKFGSYTGNGSTDGPMIETGFRPRWILIKIAVGGTDSWLLYDAIRSPYNVVDDFMQPNNAEQEATGNSNALDFLSNGFKLRGSVAGTNGSGNTYIYAAYAEAPAQNLFGGQSTAR